MSWKNDAKRVHAARNLAEWRIAKRNLKTVFNDFGRQVSEAWRQGKES